MAEETEGRVRELMATLVGIVLLALATGVWAYAWVHPLPRRWCPGSWGESSLPAD